MVKESKSNIPIRIQRKRTRGYKMPADAVYVGRPSAYGNPFKIGDNVSGFGEIKSQADAVHIYSEWMKLRLSGAYGERPEWSTEMKSDLSKIKGKNLACWCSLDKPCHADVLLKLANEDTK